MAPSGSNSDARDGSFDREQASVDGAGGGGGGCSWGGGRRDVVCLHPSRSTKKVWVVPRLAHSQPGNKRDVSGFVVTNKMVQNQVESEPGLIGATRRCLTQDLGMGRQEFARHWF